MNLAKLNEMTMPKARLLFCEIYLEKYDIEDAFRRAFPEVLVANGNYYPKACRMLKRQDVQKYIGHRRGDIQKIMCLDASRIAQEIAAVAFTDITDVMDDLKTVKQFSEMTTTAKKSIKKIIIKETNTRWGLDRTTTVELHDKLRGLSELMKVLGIGAGDASTTIEGDLTVVNNVIQVSAKDLTDAQLKQLVSTGHLPSKILEKDEEEVFDEIPDSDFS